MADAPYNYPPEKFPLVGYTLIDDLSAYRRTFRYRWIALLCASWRSRRNRYWLWVGGIRHNVTGRYERIN